MSSACEGVCPCPLPPQHQFLTYCHSGLCCDQSPALLCPRREVVTQVCSQALPGDSSGRFPVCSPFDYHYVFCSKSSPSVAEPDSLLSTYPEGHDRSVNDSRDFSGPVDMFLLA